MGGATVTVHGLTIPSSLCCVCVCAGVCVWVCLIEADSLQLRIIYRGYIRSCHAVLCCQILRLSAVSWSVVFVRSCFLLPWFLISAVSWTLSPDTWLPIVSLRYLPQPTESSTLFPQFHLSDVFAINRSCFRNLNPPVFIYDRKIWPQYGFSGDSWFSGTVSQQQRSYGSTGGEYVEHWTSCAGVSSAGVRAHHPVATIKITRCATHTADSPSPREQQPSART